MFEVEVHPSMQWIEGFCPEAFFISLLTDPSKQNYKDF